MAIIQLMQQNILSIYSNIQEWLVSLLAPSMVLRILWSITIIGLSFIFRNVITSGILSCLKLILRHMLPDHLYVVVEACRKPLSFLIPLLGIFIGAYILPFPTAVDPFFNLGLRIALWILFFWACANLSNGLFDAIGEKKRSVNLTMLGALRLFKKITFIAIVGMAVAVILTSLNYPVTSLIAAMGIGGAALAFASKDTIANFFGSLSLVFDHPFKIGDAIKIGSDIDGTVESIGLRSTQIRTIEDALLNIPNNVLANYNIHNWSNLNKRRVQQILRLNYGTQLSVLKNIIQSIKKTIEGDAIMNLVVINFFEFGESSLDIQLIYYIKEPNYTQFLNKKEQMNFKIMQIIEECGASFAFPSRTLYMGDEQTEKLLNRR